MVKSGKKSLKTALESQQSRLKRKEKAAQAAQSQTKAPSGKTSKGKSKQPLRSTVPFCPTDRILLIGEGNFSFALALLKHPTLSHLPPENITATAYDSEAECMQKYPDAMAIVKELRQRGVEVMFEIDGTALERYKTFRGRTWDRIVWNFPHSGKGITDQDRNIRMNQIMLLDFLLSAASFLKKGPAPSYAGGGRVKKHSAESDSDNEEEDEMKISYEDQDMVSPSYRGTILITLRNVHPYTAWELPKLAKTPPPPAKRGAVVNPSYIQLRSFAFRRADWPGYQHRMTKGERVYGTGTTGTGGEDRTWEFCLRDPTS